MRSDAEVGLGTNGPTSRPNNFEVSRRVVESKEADGGGDGHAL
jgi:hypothetical protein